MTKILIIDDEEIIRRRLKDLLETEDYTVITASNGEKGLETFQKEGDCLTNCVSINSTITDPQIV